MYVDSLMIAIFFKILNFIIIIGCSAYVFKAYAYESVTQMMDEKEAMFKQLRASKVDARRQDKCLELQLKEQQELGSYLKDNVGIWKKIVLQKQETVKRERQTRYEQMQHIRNVQGRMINLHHVEQKIMPVVLKKAQSQLEKKFSSEEQGQEFIRALLGDMQKGVQ